MKLIDEVLAVIDDGTWGWEKHPQILAEALYAACKRSAPGPNFLAIATNLDQENRSLVTRLMSLTEEIDYSNDDQYQAAKYLQEKYGLGTDKYEYV